MEWAYDNVVLELPEDWEEITDELEPGTPLTFARVDGFGALQMTIAEYAGGALPEVSTEALEQLLRAFFRSEGVSDLEVQPKMRDGLLMVSGEGRVEDSLCRAWYLSNGRDFVFVTYLVQTDLPPEHFGEISAAEGIVESIRF